MHRWAPMVQLKGIEVLLTALKVHPAARAAQRDQTDEPGKHRSGKRSERPPSEDKKSEQPAEENEDDYDMMTLFRDVLISVAVILALFLALYFYTQKYPPLVVVESGSMAHGEESELGVIDQGDLVLIKKVDSPKDLTTWGQGKKDDYKTYSDYGDVIIYFKNGHTDDTPIIHRAIAYIKFNETAKDDEGNTQRYFDVPEFDIYHVTVIHINIVQRGRPVSIVYKPEQPFDGYITKGDNNGNADQGPTGLNDNQGKDVQQVKIDWVDGVARGEIPWYGLIKLKLSGNEHIEEAPSNSWTLLIVSISIFLSLPFVVQGGIILWEKYQVNLEKTGQKEGKKSLTSGSESSSTNSNSGQKNTREKGDKDTNPPNKEVENKENEEKEKQEQRPETTETEDNDSGDLDRNEAGEKKEEKEKQEQRPETTETEDNDSGDLDRNEAGEKKEEKAAQEPDTDGKEEKQVPDQKA